MAKGKRIKVGACTKNQLMMIAGGHKTYKGHRGEEIDRVAEDAAKAKAEAMSLFGGARDKVVISGPEDVETFTVLTVRLVEECDGWVNQRSAGQIRRMLAAALIEVA